MIKFFFKIVALFCLINSDLLAQDPSPPAQDFFQEDMTSHAPVTYKGAFIRMIVTLFGLLVLIVLSVWMLRRISFGRMRQLNYSKEIKILERRPLSAKSILYLVEVSGKKIVIAESQLEIRTIATTDLLTKEDL